MKSGSGIRADVLASQVRQTAGWLWDDPRAAEVTAIVGAAERAPYFTLLLAAHFATVATFVPTDVDVRIRHHTWTAIDDERALAAACAEVDRAAAWDAAWVSARVLDRVSGHDGEWLAVRAGALGRAGVVAPELAAGLAARIDEELAREEAMLAAAFASGDARRALTASTILAHNLGDLSRVVEAWPNRPELAAFRASYTRLGHPTSPSPSPRAAFARAGALNKAMMALENHRFLALRKARGLRASRALLLPIGPWFDPWGETVATHPSLDEAARADVVTALLETHASSPEQQGCLRALAGIHRATRGGLESFVPSLPARLRKDALRGRVREAIDLPEDRFALRFSRRFEAWIAGASSVR